MKGARSLLINFLRKVNSLKIARILVFEVEEKSIRRHTIICSDRWYAGKESGLALFVRNTLKRNANLFCGRVLGGENKFKIAP